MFLHLKLIKHKWTENRVCRSVFVAGVRWRSKKKQHVSQLCSCCSTCYLKSLLTNKNLNLLLNTHTHTASAAHTVIFNCLFSIGADYEEAINSPLASWPIIQPAVAMRVCLQLQVLLCWTTWTHMTWLTLTHTMLILVWGQSRISAAVKMFQSFKKRRFMLDVSDKHSDLTFILHSFTYLYLL